MMAQDQDAPETLTHSRGLIRSGNRCYRNMHPRDAACLVIVDMDNKARPRILMGRRRPDLAFMPNSLVFPGGRVEASDYRAVRHGIMAETILSKLMRHTPKGKFPHRHRGLALAHAALRETREETGLLIGAYQASCGQQTGMLDFSGWSFLARAITPPRFARRFDTRFFAVSSRQIADALPIVDGEFVTTHWLTLDTALQEDVASVTKIILKDFKLRLDAGSLNDPETSVPFYFMRGAYFHRIML